MDKFLQFFKDTGNYSMTRLLSFVCVVAALLISLVVVWKGQSLDSAVGLVSVFLAAGFGGKIAQKFAETKEPDSEEK